MKGCSVLWCGEYRQDWVNKPHSHGYFQLLMILDGTGQVELDGRVYTGDKGDIFLIPPEAIHAVYGRSGGNSLLKLMDIKFNVTEPSLYEDLRKMETGARLENMDWALHDFHRMVQESAGKQKYYYDMANAILYQLLVRLIRQCCYSETRYEEEISPVPPTVSQYKGVNIKCLMEYIESNYANIVTLNHLSAQANINKTTLIEIFRTLYGMTPIRYLNRLRLQKAKELLVNTDVGIGEVAELVGFQSIHYFSRYFKEKENCSPTEYRIRGGQNKYYVFGGDALQQESFHQKNEKGMD